MKFRLAYRLLFLICFQLMGSFAFSQTVGGVNPSDDYDGDGIINSIDLDDDNDGILDAVESPDCYYTANEWHFGNRPDITVTSGLVMTSPQNQPQKLVDGKNSGVSYDVRFVATTTVGSGQEVYKFNMNIPVKLSKITLGYTGIYSQFNDGTKLILRGSNDGSTWTNLSGTSGTPEVIYDATINTSSATETSTIYPYPATTQYGTSANIFSVTQNAAKYQYYDIFWSSAGGINATGYANEVYFDVASDYNASAHPKISCSNDTDGDGILNQQDLDSDGDGCPDAKESGITATLTSASVTNLVGATIASGTSTSTIQNAIVAGTGTSTFGNNGFVNSLETASESGIYSGTYNYNYANNKTLSTCLDSDGDGVPDVNDLDDDNDGALDIVECPAPGVKPLLSRFDIASGASMTQSFTGFPEEVWIDIWALDNNFNLKINGSDITNVSELNFAPMGAANPYPKPYTDIVRADGTPIYPAGTVWTYPNTAQYPLIRVKISNNGYAKIYGYDFVNGTGNYKELVLVNAVYQKVPINLSGTNTIVFSQDNTWAPSYLNAEFNTFNSAGFCDTDGDGVENRLDLDADNDGCSDAYESKTTTNTSVNFKYDNTNNFGTNGFLNSLETVADNGIYKSNYPYDFAIDPTIKSCLDSDTDGVPDIYDLDDDNDGILDAIESPSCFYSLSELSKPATVSSDLNLYNTTGTYDLTNSIDGLVATYTAFKSGQFLANKEVLKYTANSLIAINSLTLNLDFRAISTDANSTFKLQGSDDNVLWDDLSNAPISSVVTVFPATLVLNNDLQPTKKYKYFRIYGVAGTTNYGGVAEATFNLASSTKSSANPKLTCINDTDGDGIPNHLDLDSDGDACPDAKEAGVIGTLTTGSVVNLTTPSGTATSTTSGVANSVAAGIYSANGFADALETTTESGLYSGTYNYDFAINKLFNACTDTDGDGVPDLIDIDDDNDGILDAIESPTCFYNKDELSVPISISTELLPNSTNVISRAIDGDATTNASFTVNQNWIGKEILKVAAVYPVTISSLDIDVPSGWSFSNTVTTNTFKLQGSTDNFIWTDLSAALNSSLSAATLSIANTLAPNNKFKYFRIIGVGGVSYYAGASEIRLNIASTFIQSQYTKPTCLTGRNDADLIPNYLDLDSDGDGCSDALEAGTTTSTTANFAFTGSPSDFGANGFYNTLEKTNAESNLYKGVYTYYYADNALFNACTDTDSDGVPDLIDIDDDNDGILDAVESPTCFYNTVELSQPISISTELLPYSTNLIGYAIDAITTTKSAFDVSQNWVGKELFKLEALFPIPLASLDLDLVSWALSLTAANTFKLQGSGDNVAWVDLSTAQSSTATTGTFTLQNTIAPTNKYKYYRIIGVAGVSNYGGVTDIRFNLANSFIQSQYTKPTCLTGRTDGDLIPNHLDLDSDGDGCSDALEAGTTTSTTANFAFTGSNFGANGFLNTLETATESGVYTGTYYYDYATNSAISTCTDRDGDGVPDYIDLDNDNDGVLDAVESPTCFYTLAELANPANPAEVSSELTQHTASFVIGNSIDGVGTTASAFATGQDWVGKEIFKFTAKNYIAISGMSFDLVSWALSSAAASTFKLQGSGDNASWKDLSVATFSTATTGTFTISNTLATNTKFKYYRLIGVAGTSSYGGVYEARLNLVSSANASANPKNTCTNDTDGDGILNQNDLDSDGDGCPDAIEAGTAQLGTTAFGNTSFFNPSTTGANGFANKLETATESGVYSGTYKYVIAIVPELNGCLDSDGDGISNIDDIDDDNDGITDLKELNCTLTNSTDGTCTAALKSASTYGIFTHCSGWNAFDFDPSPSVLDRADFDYMGVNGTDPYFDLQGSYAGPNITGKMVKSFATTAGLSYTFEVELISVFVDDPTTGSKPYLRAIDASTGIILGTTYLNGSGIRTVSFTGIGSATLITLGYDIRLGNIGSLFWKGGKMTQNGEAYQICSLQDTDNDGVPNQLDLDSDGDGCADAV
ncbi:MAG: hypothetical protein NTV75_05020, partial [Bacteroidia bacterium]|nr:hypothetical protein [Bacteroidia bacterium]